MVSTKVVKLNEGIGLVSRKKKKKKKEKHPPFDHEELNGIMF